MRLQLTRPAQQPRVVLGTLAVLLSGVALPGCAGPAPIAEPPAVDRTAFEEVYPVLLRDCGYPACHGDRARFFRVFGPGRSRLEDSTPLYDPPTPAEVNAAFDRARSMLVGVDDPLDALLLRKPLETSAGGAAHQGLDALGRNVYASPDDPSYRLIARWAGAELGEPDGGLADAGLEDGAVLDGAVDARLDVGDARPIDASRDTGDAP